MSHLSLLKAVCTDKPADLSSFPPTTDTAIPGLAGVPITLEHKPLIS